MDHLFLLRDIFDLLNVYDFDALPNATKDKLRSMRHRIDAYVLSQGYEIGYIAPDEVALLRDGVVVIACQCGYPLLRTVEGSGTLSYVYRSATGGLHSEPITRCPKCTVALDIGTTAQSARPGK